MWRGRGPAPRVLHWGTEGLVANALAVGFGRRKRILVSDALQGALKPFELEAVLSHELAHFERRHAAALVAGTAGAVLLVSAAIERLVPATAEDPGLGWVALALAAAALPFLFASRRFEQQADLDAIARGPAHAAGLAGALTLLGRRRPRLALRHPAADARVAEILRALAEPDRAALLQRRAERARRAMWGLFLAGLAGIAATT
ncbi:MAG: M48 family metalloprotease [Planctomycetes bacterium]|nr:M48 family metalloprotease [Planctomycetota bacterium]